MGLHHLLLVSIFLHLNMIYLSCGDSIGVFLHGVGLLSILWGRLSNVSCWLWFGKGFLLFSLFFYFLLLYLEGLFLRWFVSSIFNLSLLNFFLHHSFVLRPLQHDRNGWFRTNPWTSLRRGASHFLFHLFWSFLSLWVRLEGALILGSFELSLVRCHVLFLILCAVELLKDLFRSSSLRGH